MAVSRRLAELRLELRFLMRSVVWFRLVVRLGRLRSFGIIAANSSH